MAKPVLLLSQIIKDTSVFRAPRVVAFNRLEARPRTLDFTSSLRAEVRDPLWMLTRQWQMGEFQGDDAGSPIFAKIHLETTKLKKFQPDSGPVRDFDDSIPLEAQVERMPVSFSQQQKLRGAFSD